MGHEKKQVESAAKRGDLFVNSVVLVVGEQTKVSFSSKKNDRRVLFFRVREKERVGEGGRNREASNQIASQTDVKSQIGL